MADVVGFATKLKGNSMLNWIMIEVRFSEISLKKSKHDQLSLHAYIVLCQMIISSLILQTETCSKLQVQKSQNIELGPSKQEHKQKCSKIYFKINVEIKTSKTVQYSRRKKRN